MRSSAWAGLPIGGQANSFGKTDHSLARISGTTMMPTIVCSPWLSAKSHVGPVGQSKSSRSKSLSRGTIGFVPRSGL